MFLHRARSFRALIQASRQRRPNVINGTLTGTASAPTCSGSQTGAQDDVKTDENAALFAQPQHALRVRRASLRSNWITTCHGFVGVDMGRSAYNPGAFAWGRNQAAYFGRNSRENGLYQ